LLVLLNSMRLLAFERRQPTTRLRPILQMLDRWIDRATDVDELLHAAAHRWKPLTFGVLAIAVTAYALSGLTAVGRDEEAVVRQFGRPLVRNLSSGLHWRWPWPVESVDKIQPDRIRTVEVGFRVVASRERERSDKPRATFSWVSQHEGEGVLRLRD